MQLPEIESERLLLRMVSSEDAKDIYEYMSLPVTTQYLYVSPLSYERTVQFIRVEYLSYRQQGNPSPYAIVLKGINKVIGVCYFHSEEDDIVEIGFILNPKFGKKGYMQEALNRMLAVGFEFCHYRRIEANVMEGNERSENLLVKLGFTMEGIRREYAIKNGIRRNVKMFSILDHEWRKRYE